MARGIVHIAALAIASVVAVEAQRDPALVGYITTNGGYSDSRVCDYPQTVSTSNGYVQCCPTSGACPFYTACSSNTLVAPGGTTVPCDVNPTLTCNTGIVLATAGATQRGSYLACWQTSLGSNPFTFVQATGGSGALSTSASSSSTRSGSTAVITGASITSTTTRASSSSSTSSAPTSTGAANVNGNVIGGGVAGAIALLAQAIF